MDTKNTKNIFTNFSGENGVQTADFTENKEKEIYEEFYNKNYFTKEESEAIEENQNYITKMKIITKGNLKELKKDQELSDFENNKNTKKENTKINIFIGETIKEEIKKNYRDKKIPQYIVDSMSWINKIIAEGKTYLETDMKTGGRIKNNNLKRIVQIQRGEVFPVRSQETKENQYVRFEIDKKNGMYILKNEDGTYSIYEKNEKGEMIGVDAKTGLEISMSTPSMQDNCILNKGDYILHRHIEDDADLKNMEKTMIEGKKIADNILANKNEKVKIILSSSRLFDPEFIEHFKKTRKELGIKEDSNIIKIRENTAKYGGYLPPTKSDNYKNCIHNNKKNSLTKAVDTYKDENGELKKIKDGRSFIDLEELEKWYKKEHISDQN